jgi:hypothetical protein
MRHFHSWISLISGCRWKVRWVRPPSLSLLTDTTALEEYDRRLQEEANCDKNYGHWR